MEEKRKRTAQLLAQLRAELAASDAYSAEARAALQDAARAIETHVALPLDEVAASRQTFSLRDLVLRIEGQHPQAARVLHELADVLGKAGV
jgi:hypothetical protein